MSSNSLMWASWYDMNELLNAKKKKKKLRTRGENEHRRGATSFQVKVINEKKSISMLFTHMTSPVAFWSNFQEFSLLLKGQ